MGLKVLVKQLNMSCGIRWAFDLTRWNPNQEEWCQAMEKIQLGDRERIRRFKYQIDAKASIVGLLMMHKWSSKFLNQPVTFSRSGRGRPISPVSGWDFNVSHHGNFTVFAAEQLQSDSQIGVDVMRLSDNRHDTEEKQRNFFRLMRRQFTDDEWHLIEHPFGDSTSMATFFRLWSLKESFVKAIGTGLTVDLKNINFKVSSPLLRGEVTSDTQLFVNGDRQDPWIFEESLLDDDHCVSVAVKNLGGASHQVLPFIHLGDVSELLSKVPTHPYNTSSEDWADFQAKFEHKSF